MVSIGTMVWLASELMFFGGLFAMYFTLRSTSPELWAENTAILNVNLALVNTIILVPCHGLGSFHLVCAFPCSIPGAHLGPVTLPALPVRRHGPWLSR